ncbi:MAG TPA: metallophosphoesterase, partial [Chitinophagaceae bacterium]|nr:metallophosphoesterase [Chitinophagaceae bacterium]
MITVKPCLAAHRWIVLIGILFGTYSCKTIRNGAFKKDDGKLEVVFVQVNDVYEIGPLAGGKSGGIARIATLKKQYLRANPNTLLVISGDFVSPSVYNSLKYQGTPIRGRQMVESLNAAGMDLAVFGNHEFDISETDIQNRINESQFKWVSSNTFKLVNGNAVPFQQVHQNTSE